MCTVPRDAKPEHAWVSGPKTSLSTKAPKRCHVDGAGTGERILDLRTRCAVDNETCELHRFIESSGKVRIEMLHVGHHGDGVPEAFIDVADLSIIANGPLIV